MINHLSIIGLGKLGSPLLAVFAAAGFEVIGVDTNKTVVSAIHEGRAPVQETGLQDLLTAHRGHYRATDSITSAVKESDATFVIVPTPTGPDGGFVLDYVQTACELIGLALREKKWGYHLVVITSTVMPGHMRDLCTTLEGTSGKRCGEDFGLCYSPEFIALGSVIRDSQYPDYALIGAEDERAGDTLEAIYRRVHDAPVVRTNWVNAEIAKIAQNAYVTMKITYANQLAALCGHIPGANVDEVTRAIGHDRRVSPHYLRGGTAYGGPCFPRDCRAFNRAANQAGMALPLALLTDRLNRHMVDELRLTVAAHAHGQSVIGVLGLAYKPNTPVIEESASIALIEQLVPSYRVIAYDALAMGEAKKALPSDVVWASSAGECVRLANVVVLMLPDGELVYRVPIEGWRDKTLIDPWRVVWGQHGAAQKFVGTYIPLGIGPTEREVERV